MNLKRGYINNKGQVTIFIIVAILIVGLAVLLYFLLPGLKSNAETQTSSPSEYIDTCMRSKIINTVEITSLKGGVYNSTNVPTYNYLGNKTQYLCYTNQYYAPCVVQEPLLLQHMESSIKDEIISDTNSCFQSLVESYKNKGYEASLKNSQTEPMVEILPGRIIVTFDNELTLKKSETQNYKNFQITIDSKLYELSGFAMSIMDWEQKFGDAPLETYMNFYPELIIKKSTQLDGTDVYLIKNVESKDKFQFAVRSLVLPPGY
jgi:hypothetical protein